ncbi:eukaryotic translation initiation factor 4 gamma-like [Chironomus tepperi]|uniref:eukaryotic translation initiation factor 4 gamma n=1 Tax=Chironomus tepperi TaxID=113505 RepID=UPI00391FB5A5
MAITEAPIQRRQLNHVQQNHILTDIQKHQHRFNVQQPQLRNQFGGFVQQQSQQSFAFPQPQTNPNTRFFPSQPQPSQQLPNQQPPQLFRQPSIQAPVQPQNTQFQRSVQNQVGQVSFNQPQPQFLAPQSGPIFKDANGFGPIAAPLVQQPPIRPQQNFFPNGNVQFAPQQQSQQPPVFTNFQPQNQNPFIHQSQSLPLEQRSNVFFDTRTEEQKRNEELGRQKLIEKHEKFAQKYFQNQQAQVQRLHEDFVQKQKILQVQTQEKLRAQQSPSVQAPNFVRQQGVKPTDLTAFEKSVQQYYQQFPTTQASTTTTKAPTTTTTTTESSLNVVPLKKSKVKQEIKILNAEDIKQLLQGDRQSTLLSQLKQDALKGSKSAKAKSPLSRDELLKQLKQTLAEETPDLGGKDFTAQDIVLPNGEKVQVIRTTDPELIRKAQGGQLVEPIATGTTQAPLSIEDLAKSGFLPAGGTDFEVIKQSESGLQKVQKVPSQKKVTFVYLEEQDDGSYKVQGVKSNNDKEVKTAGSEVDTILKRIKNGDIQLPPAAKKVVAPIEVPTPKTTVAQPTTTTTQQQQTTISTRLPVISTTVPKNHRATNGNIISTAAKSSPSTIKYTASTTAPQTVTPVKTPITRGSSAFHYSFSATTQKEDNGRSPYSTLPTFETTERNNIFSVTPRVQRLSTTEAPDYATASSINYIRNAEAQKLVQTVSASTVSPAFSTPVRSSISYSPTFTTTPPTTVQATTQKTPDLAEILRNSGLFAMAKYLRQSGLDSILNETGPYTIFAPTDKAFKSLLVQLGGPEKAEEKFRNNPRLLSGLLLHHVIPGSFKIEELQDEMTGVSLAGTQLRVNQYQMQDIEWNDIKVTTINGATISPDNNDIVIPQGIAHAIDRCMFPLPVGDILQTLQSDRERRFTNFLRAVFASNMADTLQNKGIKTYTIFAPTDFAFSHLTPEELNTMISDKDSAQQLVNRHIVPGTLFTSGMRFYQVKDTLAEDKSITVQKNGGKVKVNESTILTSNIPATNGVIHAIDTLL